MNNILRLSVQVGDIVLPKNDSAMLGVDYGYGVIIDMYEDDYGIVYYQVGWPGADCTWWAEEELELISEAR